MALQNIIVFNNHSPGHYMKSFLLSLLCFSLLPPLCLSLCVYGHKAKLTTCCVCYSQMHG